MMRNNRKLASLSTVIGLMGAAGMPALAQQTGFAGTAPLVVPGAEQAAPIPASGADATPKFNEAQLKELVGPIALYPDPLLAQVLAGATYPLEIVQASRFVKANANDPALKEKTAAQAWDPSVRALAHYPSVLAMMDENLEWTQNLGAAFMYQQDEVMATVQLCRSQAQSVGNLQTSAEQKVIVEERIIQIVPADPEIIYVPVYEPRYVYVERRPNFYGSYISFGIGCHVGAWLDLDCDWRARRVCYGGWYDHGHRPDVHVHRDVRDYRDDRRDDRRDNDRRDGDAWRRDVSRAGPLVQQPQRNSPQRSAPERVQINDRSANIDRQDRDPRGQRDDRPASDSQHGFRVRPAGPVTGNVRSAPGVTRSVTPPTPTPSPSPAPQRVAPVQPPFNAGDRADGRFEPDGRRDRRSDDQTLNKPSLPSAPDIGEKPSLIPTPGSARIDTPMPRTAPADRAPRALPDAGDTRARLRPTPGDDAPAIRSLERSVPTPRPAPTFNPPQVKASSPSLERATPQPSKSEIKAAESRERSAAAQQRASTARETQKRRG